MIMAVMAVVVGLVEREHENVVEDRGAGEW